MARIDCVAFATLLAVDFGCVATEKVIDVPSATDQWLADTCSTEPGCQHVGQATDDVDVLFVIDNSNSMKQEQLRMPTQFRRLVRALMSGDRDDDGEPDFPAARSLHLAVVSSDMGLLGVSEVKDCEGFGDDGLLLHTPSTDLDNCGSSYPQFITVDGDSPDLEHAADDFACMATLGIDGCGFEQQLEAGLKALWPAEDPMPEANGSNRIRFLGDAMRDGMLGHGDRENAGFLRDDPAQSSVLAVVVLSDEDDGSSRDTHHLTPRKFLDQASEIAKQPINLRNYYNPDELYPRARYIEGFKLLRPRAPQQVVFGAIVGVPPELDGDDEVGDIATDAEAREAFYDTLLDDPQMQEEPVIEAAREEQRPCARRARRSTRTASRPAKRIHRGVSCRWHAALAPTASCTRSATRTSIPRSTRSSTASARGSARAAWTQRCRATTTAWSARAACAGS